MQKQTDFEDLVKQLAAHPALVSFQPGLTVSELGAAEDRFGFAFPPDLRELLQIAMPAGKKQPDLGSVTLGRGFPDWRDLASADLQKQIAWPVDSIIVDVREAGFWPQSWGSRPPTNDEATESAMIRLSAAPKLIPVYGHRYICEDPHAEGNPILSVWGSDIIYYGSDISAYLNDEFLAKGVVRTFSDDVAKVPFWSDIIE